MRANILITDDDTSVRIILAKYIRRLGYGVLEADSGAEAIRLLSDSQAPAVDVMLTDIWMPAMSGLNLLKAVHQINPDLPVAMITASASLDTSIAALNEGAYAYLVKPIKSEDVREVLERGIQKSQALREQRTLQSLLEQYRELEGDLQALQERQRDVAQVMTDDLLAELIRGLRHELGNTATAIKLNLSVLEEESADPANLREHIQDLEASTDHLIGLLGKLREYPGHSGAPELIDLRQILMSLADMAREKIDRQHVRLEYMLPDDDIWIHGTQLDLSRVFLHILENAIEASADVDQPHIRITVQVTGKEVEVTIADEGHGFPSVGPERLFSPGYTTKTVGGTVRGLGLGLFLARAIVNLHNGQIWLENRPTGGAAVHIQLPLASCH
jgi:two-component system, sensor histidine kinase and response regulator